VATRLDEDGLHIGTMVNEGDVIAASHSVMLDPSTGKLVNRDGQTELHKYKDSETAFVEEVRVLGSENGTDPCQAFSIKFRVPRSPVIGDKFSSRHGQRAYARRNGLRSICPSPKAGSNQTSSSTHTPSHPV
jgi:DNA-directed RNA polymerase I subunit RPA2